MWDTGSAKRTPKQMLLPNNGLVVNPVVNKMGGVQKLPDNVATLGVLEHAATAAAAASKDLNRAGILEVAWDNRRGAIVRGGGGGGGGRGSVCERTCRSTRRTGVSTARR